MRAQNQKLGWEEQLPLQGKQNNHRRTSFFPVLPLQMWLLQSHLFHSNTLHQDGYCLRYAFIQPSGVPHTATQPSWADKQCFAPVSFLAQKHFATRRMHSQAHLGAPGCSWCSNRSSPSTAALPGQPCLCLKLTFTTERACATSSDGTLTAFSASLPRVF